MMRRLGFLVAIVAIAGCSRPRYVEPTPRGVVLKSAQLGMYRKEVVTKQEPDTFVAPDATICRVSPDVFKSTPLHSIAYCNWQ
jgi:hypothetical protein